MSLTRQDIGNMTRYLNHYRYFKKRHFSKLTTHCARCWNERYFKKYCYSIFSEVT